MLLRAKALNKNTWAQGRPALREFNTVIKAVNAMPYKEVMVIDGNGIAGSTSG